MRDDIAIVLRTCADCGFPIRATIVASCPYCAAPPDAGSQCQALYGLSLTSLQRLRLSLRAAPDTRLRTVLDVLVALYAISDEPATPAQLTEVVDKVAADRLGELPLPRRSPCFCHSGRRYQKCHGRRAR
ncbi:hypothetical protein MMAD_09760 [Mycolicibacterium madagascariense]|uniref:Preprotein translocase SecA n=1 Tax=Mycolicibacterium madagascariense TaxID=212765 RepID=A0A7I7XDF7_9MYCO|nr:SEC-C metal-binding domain-containing protein [Mycolicibacterium madagascariense]MCV7011302.1 SEC-C domain-containing protein [Mycolicibacterium madagascariense]BBZ26681.1 hypothetical protein MMAD_09760 [Mycolicibacterium madagascariense]